MENEAKFDLAAHHTEREWNGIEEAVKQGNFHFAGEKSSWLGKLVRRLMPTSVQEAQTQVVDALSQTISSQGSKGLHERSISSLTTETLLKLSDGIASTAVAVLKGDNTNNSLSALLANLDRIRSLIPSNQQRAFDHEILHAFDPNMKTSISKQFEKRRDQITKEAMQLNAETKKADLGKKEEVIALGTQLSRILEAIDEHERLSKELGFDQIKSINDMKAVREVVEKSREALFRNFLPHHPGKFLVRLTNGSYALVDAMVLIQSSVLLREFFSNFTDPKMKTEEGALKDLTHFPPIPELALTLLEGETILAIDMREDDGKSVIELYKWINSWGIDSHKIQYQINSIHLVGINYADSKILRELVKLGLFKLDERSKAYSLFMTEKYLLYLSNILRSPPGKDKNLSFFLTSDVMIDLIINSDHKIPQGFSETVFAFIRNPDFFPRIIKHSLEITHKTHSTFLIDFMIIAIDQANQNTSEEDKNELKRLLLEYAEKDPQKDTLIPLINEAFDNPKGSEGNPVPPICLTDFTTHPFDRDIARQIIKMKSMGEVELRVGNQTYYFNFPPSLKEKLEDPLLREKVGSYRVEIFVLLSEYLTHGWVNSPLPWQDTIDLYHLATDLGMNELKDVLQSHVYTAINESRQFRIQEEMIQEELTFLFPQRPDHKDSALFPPEEAEAPVPVMAFLADIETIAKNSSYMWAERRKRAQDLVKETFSNDLRAQKQAFDLIKPLLNINLLSEIIPILRFPEDKELLAIISDKVYREVPGVKRISYGTYDAENPYFEIEVDADKELDKTLQWLERHTHLFPGVTVRHNNYATFEAQREVLRVLRNLKNPTYLALQLDSELDEDVVPNLNHDVWEETLSTHPNLSHFELDCKEPLRMDSPPIAESIHMAPRSMILRSKNALGSLLTYLPIPITESLRVYGSPQNEGINSFIEAINNHPSPIRKIEYWDNSFILGGLAEITVPNLKTLDLINSGLQAVPEELAGKIQEKNPQLVVNFREVEPSPTSRTE